MPKEPRPIAVYTSLPAARVIPIIQEHITCDPDFIVSMIVTSHPERMDYDIPIFYFNFQNEMDYTGEVESGLFQAMMVNCIDLIITIDADFEIGIFTSDVYVGKVIKYSSKLPVSFLPNQLQGVRIYHPNRRYVPVTTERATTHDLSMHPLRATLYALESHRISFDNDGAHFEQYPANVVPVSFGKSTASSWIDFFRRYVT